MFNVGGRGCRTQNSHSTILLLGVIAIVLCSSTRCLQGDEAKATVKEPPKILLALPLAISTGETKSLLIRGLRLDQAVSVQSSGIESPVDIRILKKEASAPPDKLEAGSVGDTQMEVTFTLPAEFTAESLALTVTTADGTSAPFSIPLIVLDQLALEAEPNDNLRKPQSIAFGQTISGSIAQAKDVDVYEFSGTAGQSVVAEVFAARRGSPCDAHLTLFDAAGQIVAINDDTSDSRDSILRIQVPRTETYRLVILDATDRGSSLHQYLLRLIMEQSPAN